MHLIEITTPTLGQETPLGLQSPRPGYRLHRGDVIPCESRGRALTYIARGRRLDLDALRELPKGDLDGVRALKDHGTRVEARIAEIEGDERVNEARGEITKMVKAASRILSPPRKKKAESDAPD